MFKFLNSFSSCSDADVLLQGYRVVKHYVVLFLSIPNLELFPNWIPIELSRIAFPTIVLPKDDRIDSAQEEQLGLPCWTMIWATCLDIPIWGIFNNFEASTILTWVYADTAFPACLALPLIDRRNSRRG